MAGREVVVNGEAIEGVVKVRGGTRVKEKQIFR